MEISISDCKQSSRSTAICTFFPSLFRLTALHGFRLVSHCGAKQVKPCKSTAVVPASPAVHTALCELLGVSIKLMTPPYQFAHRSAIYKFGQESDRVGVNTHAIRFGCKPKKGSVQVWSKCDVRSAILSV